MALSLVDEQSIVEAHRAGDPTAFAEIVAVYRGPLRAYALRRLNDEHAADDAVQETFLRAFRALPRFAGEFRLTAWLYRILNNVCLDEFERRRRDADLVRRAGVAGHAPTTTTAPPPAEPAELDARLQAALSSLPPGHRDAFLQRAVVDLSYADVADRAGISEENARARVHRARRALRRLVDLPNAVGLWIITGGIGRKLARLSDQAPPPADGPASAGQTLAYSAGQMAVAAPDRVITVSRVVALTAASLPIAGAAVPAEPRPAPPPVEAPAVARTPDPHAPVVVAPVTTTDASATVQPEGSATAEAGTFSAVAAGDAATGRDQGAADVGDTATAEPGSGTSPPTGPAVTPTTLPVAPPSEPVPLEGFTVTDPVVTGGLESLTLTATVTVSFDGQNVRAELRCRGEHLDQAGGTLNCRLKALEDEFDLVLDARVLASEPDADGHRVGLEGSFTSRSSDHSPLAVAVDLVVADTGSTLAVAPIEPPGDA